MMTDTVEKFQQSNELADFKSLEQSSGCKFFIKVKDKVLATHRDLQTLRYCSNMLKSKPNGKIIIIGPSLKKHTRFMISTLRHLGVSCGQIVNSNTYLPGTAKGVWLLVTD